MKQTEIKFPFKIKIFGNDRLEDAIKLIVI